MRSRIYRIHPTLLEHKRDKMLAAVQAFQDVPSFDANALRLGCLDDLSEASMSLAHASSFTMTFKADRKHGIRMHRKVLGPSGRWIPCGPLFTL